jgi:hypothetical protein
VVGEAAASDPAADHDDGRLVGQPCRLSHGGERS